MAESLVLVKEVLMENRMVLTWVVLWVVVSVDL